ncbi:MAG: hypothetical protein M1829_001204 [Trizodia sp. TS-e1964]|nr:MAG: hypothetical protein M1829_001204 [Trizodia sp. TS-e1964]
MGANAELVALAAFFGWSRAQPPPPTAITNDASQNSQDNPQASKHRQQSPDLDIPAPENEEKIQPCGENVASEDAG